MDIRTVKHITNAFILLWGSCMRLFVPRTWSWALLDALIMTVLIVTHIIRFHTPVRVQDRHPYPIRDLIRYFITDCYGIVLAGLVLGFACPFLSVVLIGVNYVFFISISTGRIFTNTGKYNVGTIGYKINLIVLAIEMIALLFQLGR